MKFIPKNKAIARNNSKDCVAIEYSLGDKDITGAVIKLNGRYPDKGMVVNLKCKELAYILKGFGKLIVEGKEVVLQEGDLVLIEPGEKYYWEGKIIMFVPCTPAWYSEQHKIINK